MEQKLNVTEILKNKELGTKLWSSLFGNVYFDSASANLVTVSHHKALAKFWRNAKLYDYDEAEPTLFPSKEMRDWSKFAWKKGDVLVSMEGSKILFDKWANEDYTKFLGKIKLLGDSHCYDTAYYTLASEEEALEFIKSVEEINNGKFNRETLEIEELEKKPKFKDWDFITIKLPRGRSLICVFKAENDENYYLHASLDSRGMITINEDSYCSKSGCIVRLSTEEEKTAFFDALAKRGKIWDVEKKKIIALKKKWTPKPFDKVVVRCGEADKWSIDFFSYKVSNGYICTGDSWFGYCLPYNEETAKLVGTTDDWEGGKQ